MIEPNQAARFRATTDCVDRSGTSQKCGEQWLVRTVGAYMPTVYEEFIRTEVAHKLDDKVSLVQAVAEIRNRSNRLALSCIQPA